MSNRRLRNWLYTPDGAKLGSLDVTGVDNFWVYGRFSPAAPFERYRQLFTDLETAWKQDESEQADEFQAQVNDLAFVVGPTPEQAHPIRDFKLMQGQFEYKMLP
ncbi:MAG: hypothetical protein M3R24_31100 [Chloroflexota bacterium]|nr:hypothetical protein [Chloroflexota bacterium]